MCEIIVKVSCPHCESAKIKKNGIKKTGKQNFQCKDCKKQFQYFYRNQGADPKNQRLVLSMTLNSSGIRDIQRVLGVSISCILFILRTWFKKIEEPQVSGHYSEVQIDEMWTFVKHRKAGKRWLWYAYEAQSGKILAFHIGKRNDAACKSLMKKLNHLTIDTYFTDDWRSYKKYVPKDKHVISKDKTTNIERRNRDFRTHIKRLCRETVCFSKMDDMHFGIIKAYIMFRNAA
jgi:IS1 family transposase/transposase-like protein